MAQTVATYCRVSTDAQDTTRQFKELKQFAETEYTADHVEPFTIKPAESCVARVSSSM